MRLWTLHPKYLDPKGLVALWREALLAQKVLTGGTVGYRHHPQLERFRDHPDPVVMVATYLRAVHSEAVARGYHFDGSKIATQSSCGPVEESDGQLLFEWQHLLAKLAVRSPERYRELLVLKAPDPHPLFEIIPGPKRAWERS